MLAALCILEAVMLASSLSLDTFVAGLAYGSNRIRIPALSVQIINAVCCGILGASLLAGNLVRQHLPGWLTSAICFAILMVLGLVKLLDSATKAFIRRHSGLKKEMRFSLFSLKFILKLYADPQEADVDASKTISPMEAASLAIALSLDGMAVGFGAALGHVNGWAVILASLIANTFGMMFGCHLGNKIARTSSVNLSWLSGAVLIVMAIAKLF